MHFDLIRHTRITSTMDVARELAERGAQEGTVVLADEQTAGRGRAGHTWYSPPGDSIYASLVLRPPLAPAESGWLTMMAALAVKDEIRRMKDEIEDSAFILSIKWFNDVQLKGRKVCGILVESSMTGQQVDYAVLGIGLNVNTVFDGAPAEVQQRATSLRQTFGARFDRERVLSSLLSRLDERYTALIRARRSPADEYARHVETLGQQVEIDTGSGIICGIAARVEDDGSLIVVTERGEVAVRFGTLVRQI